MKLLAFLVGLLIATSAQAQIPLLTGPYDPGSTQGTFNVLISQINTVTAAVTGVPNSLLATGGVTSVTLGSTSAVNNVSITGGLTGFPPIISVGGANEDANAGLALQANGSGNISLLYGSGTGYVQLANQSSFVPAGGLAACPAYNGGAPLGIHSSIQGYMVMLDWMGRKRWVPAC